MLNEKQEKAVVANDRFIFLLAGAGTGKTMVVIEKLKRIFDKGINPENVLVLSFTRKSALELKDRLNILDPPLITTFHGFCYRELEREQTINIVSDTVLIDYGFSKDEITQIDFLKRNNRRTRLVDTYNRFLRENNLYDYTDLENIFINKMNNDKRFYNRISNQYKYIFVDEFQDTSKVEFILLKTFKKGIVKMFCVGDPNQSIYSFRGSSKKVIKDYLKTFNATTYILNENYRSGINILNSSNKLIKHNEGYTHFDLVTNNDFKGEVITNYFLDDKKKRMFIVDEIRKLLNKGYYQEEIAVIYRNHNFGNKLKRDLHGTYFDRINFLTIHQAKGLEFDVVFIIGLNEGKLPFINAKIEEERRLFYVAVTRAKKKLYLVSLIKDRKPSRFIKESLITKY